MRVDTLTNVDPSYVVNDASIYAKKNFFFVSIIFTSGMDVMFF